MAFKHNLSIFLSEALFPIEVLRSKGHKPQREISVDFENASHFWTYSNQQPVSNDDRSYNIHIVSLTSTVYFSNFPLTRPNASLPRATLSGGSSIFASSCILAAAFVTSPLALAISFIILVMPSTFR